jgi:hypothetical protein
LDGFTPGVCIESSILDASKTRATERYNSNANAKEMPIKGRRRSRGRVKMKATGKGIDYVDIPCHHQRPLS